MLVATVPADCPDADHANTLQFAIRKASALLAALLAKGDVTDVNRTDRRPVHCPWRCMFGRAKIVPPLCRLAGSTRFDTTSTA